ncbi:MAG: zinc ribbon domain-containing protein [Bdellovibrionota bacterium]|nr:MAG: zinc ribbon domain-containing protein [Pseudomonadota bacterium]
MPTYEYRCTKPNCGKSFEVSAKMSDAAPERAPDCDQSGCAIEKKLSRVAASVRGAAVAKESAKAAIKDRVILQNVGTESPRIVETRESVDPVHVCSKYCSHHTKTD